jgi:hypothetical protein
VSHGRTHARELLLSHFDAEGHAGGFFRRLGFEYTDERHGLRQISGPVRSWGVRGQRPVASMS